MPAIIQPLPTRLGDAAVLARQLLRLLGPAYPAPDSSASAADALALGAALALGRATNAASLAEAFPDTASALLSEWETMLGLPVSAGTLTTAQRQERLLARWRTRFAGTPNAILSAVAPLNGSGIPTLRETLARESHANPPRVFAFTLRTEIPITKPAHAPIIAAVGIMKPAHTKAQFTDTQMLGFFLGNPNSLLGNTVF